MIGGALSFDGAISWITLGNIAFEKNFLENEVDLASLGFIWNNTCLQDH